jgi:hypothetical protein
MNDGGSDPLALALIAAELFRAGTELDIGALQKPASIGDRIFRGWGVRVAYIVQRLAPLTKCNNLDTAHRAVGDVGIGWDGDLGDAEGALAR